MQSTNDHPNRDNLLGICHAIGTAFGIDPLVLRIGFGIAMLVDFEKAIVGYLALGVAVLAATLVARLTQPGPISAVA